ncbi:EamA family transporter [Candidatus Woesearchaeota archaeon]|nr:EamA family transporter [Candidatus Woesearchaeota archaeon]
MVWFVYAFLTAIFESAKDVFSKKSLKEMDEYVVSWSLMFFSLVFLLPMFIFINIPMLTSQFWIALLIGGSLNVMAIILFMKAIKASDLSLTIPMITFTPLFLLLTSPIMIGEFPTPLGLSGVLLIVVGSYVMKIKYMKKGLKGFFAPFGALIKEKGPRLMLLVAFIWSITSNFDKMGVINSSPMFWVAATGLFMAIIMLPIMLFKSKNIMQKMKSGYKALIPMGIFGVAASIFQMTAVSMTLVAYVISIKRTSTIMSVLFGHFLFKEKGLKERLIGVILMVLGVVLIMLS